MVLSIHVLLNQVGEFIYTANFSIMNLSKLKCM